CGQEVTGGHGGVSRLPRRVDPRCIVDPPDVLAPLPPLFPPPMTSV
ncbi:MAG: hypothetical protein QG597_1646, partial [Actinomycetota bacterium]|nr:hypothetical protein [Actinomycetota bacterium]